MKINAIDIKPNTYWILKQSEDIYDVVVINEVWPNTLLYSYYRHDNYRSFISRRLSIKGFLTCYKPHKILNLLYSLKG